MMHLCLDLGNSKLKFGIFNNTQLVDVGTIDYACAFDMELQHFNKLSISKITYSSVKSESTSSEILSSFLSVCSEIKHIAKVGDIPLKSMYNTPETLGIDRLVACWGARQLEKTNAILVIDAGTCITYDLLDENNNFLGGSISPGVQMRLKAMHNFTDKLPLVQTESTRQQLIGRSTKEALLSGAINGCWFEMEGFINKHSKNIKDLKVFLTGGDLIFFEDALKSDIFAEANLNLIGLNAL